MQLLMHFQVVFPVCDSTSGPGCPHLRYPPLIPESAPRRSSLYGKARAPDAYSAHLHRPLIAPNADLGAPGDPPLVPLDTSRTFLHLEPLTTARAQKHKLDQPYVNRGHYLEDGIGDVSAHSLSDAISNAIGHLGTLSGGMRDIWAPKSPPSAESFVCFYTTDPRDRKDCHDLKGFSSLPSKYDAEVVAYHSGWSGASHMLVFDRSRAPFVSPYLEKDYAVGLPEAETKWRGRWRVAAHEPTEGEGPLGLRPLPLAGPLAESITARPSSYKWLVNKKAPPQPIYTYTQLDSQEGSFFHSNLFVPYGIWVSATPRIPAATCSEEALEASSRLVLIMQGIQEEETIFTLEVPLYKIPGLHAADSDIPKEYRYVNALDYLKTTPLQRVDLLRFSYGVVGPKGGPAERMGYKKPLHCSRYYAVLGAIHVLVAEKTLSSKVYYSVDATTAEGRALREKAHAAVTQLNQQNGRKEALAEARAPLLKQLLGGGALPKPWKPYHLGPPALTRADVFEGKETASQRESGLFMGVVFRAQPDVDTELIESSDISFSRSPLSWQENHRIKFGRFDSMAYQFADLRKALNKGSLYLQEIPAEAPVVSLNQLPQVQQVFSRKVTPSFFLLSLNCTGSSNCPWASCIIYTSI